MHVDREAPTHLRASAQAIYTFASGGAGTLLGNWLSGRIVEANSVNGVVEWTMVWLVPALMSACILLLFLTQFRHHDRSISQPT